MQCNDYNADNEEDRSARELRVVTLPLPPACDRHHDFPPNTVATTLSIFRVRRRFTRTNFRDLCCFAFCHIYRAAVSAGFLPVRGSAGERQAGCSEKSFALLPAPADQPASQPPHAPLHLSVRQFSRPSRCPQPLHVAATSFPLFPHS